VHKEKEKSTMLFQNKIVYKHLKLQTGKFLNRGDKIIYRHLQLQTGKTYGTIMGHIETDNGFIRVRLLLEKEEWGLKEIWSFPSSLSKISTLCA
jgi:hypothetical protein